MNPDLTVAHRVAGGLGERATQGVLEGVHQMELTGDVGRRNDDRERRLAARRVRLEVPGHQPAPVEPVLHLGRPVLDGQLGAGGCGGALSPSRILVTPAHS